MRRGSGLAKISKPKNTNREATGTKWILDDKSVLRKRDPVVLEEGQNDVVECVRKGKSVFFTGVAGTGKSFLLNHLKRLLCPMTTFYTASTGLAAVGIGGTTTASFAGLGDGTGTVKDIVDRIRKNKMMLKKWMDCRVLIVDEISMISGVLFDKLEEIARAVRKSSRPMGGILTIACGDFLQLPPVDRLHGMINFAFEANSWPRVFSRMIMLSRVRRQNDCKFITCLNEIREGIVSKECIEMFSQHCNKKFDETDGIKTTLLYPTKEEVASINKRELDALDSKEKGRMYKFKGTHIPRGEKLLEGLAKNFNGEKELELKKHAQVLLIKNLDPKNGLVNGSRGIVIGFAPLRDGNDDSGSDHDESSTHDASDDASDDASKSTEASKDGTEGKKRSHDDSLSDEKEEELWPVVKFTCGITKTIGPEKWDIKQQGKTLAELWQVPLILGWAITIHKSQGMSLDRGRIGMGKIFEFAQFYVAASRFRSIEGISIEGRFDPSRIRAYPIAKQFYAKLKAGMNVVDDEDEVKSAAPSSSSRPPSSFSSLVSSTPTAIMIPSSMTAPRPCSSFRTSRSAARINASGFVDVNDLAPTVIPSAAATSSFKPPLQLIPRQPVSTFVVKPVTTTAAAFVVERPPAASIVRKTSNKIKVLAEAEDPLSDWDD
jgi:ATP-dependent DNA helicase PIF1